MKNVEKVTFSSNKEQYNKLTETMGSEWDVFDEENNPLYDAYIVETKAPKYVESVTKDARKIEGVSEVQNGGTNTKNLFAFSNFIQTWGLIGTALLIFIAILLISNTIRITIISRSREIQIMRLVGAKNSYIRGPFLFEGAWIGLLGATVPSIVVYLAYGIAYQTMNKSLVGQGLSMIDPKLFSPIMIATLFVLGILIGSLGSIISMRRFLKF